MPASSSELAAKFPPREGHSFLAFDLVTRELTLEVTVLRAELTETRARNAYRFYNSHTARGVLVDPEYILDAARFGDEKGDKPWGLCYVGRPKTLRNQANSLIDRPARFVFCVYLQRGPTTLFEWRLEVEHPQRPGLPVGYDDETRFPGGIRWMKED